jgi:DNA polymerase
VHGKPRKVGDVLCFPMYHPAAALHQGSLRKVIEEDMRRLPQLLRDIDSFTDTSDRSGRQLDLF